MQMEQSFVNYQIFQNEGQVILRHEINLFNNRRCRERPLSIELKEHLEVYLFRGTVRCPF